MTGDWKPKLVATRSNFAAQRFANCQTSSAAAAAEFLRLIEISHFTWVGIDLGEANMATNPACVIKLMAIPARFLTVRASVRIRLIRRNWRQTFRHQNSLRMNRHELPRHTFITRVHHNNRPWKQTFINCASVTTHARNRSSLACVGPTHRSSQQFDSREFASLSNGVVEMIAVAR